MEEQNHKPESTTAEEIEVEKMSFLDKLSAIYVEPSKVFKNIKVYGAKTTDWFLPVLLLVLFTIISNYIVTTNPDIKAELDAVQRKAIEESLDKEVKAGRITEAQKEERLNQIEEFTSGSMMKIFQYISIAIFIFVFLFIIAAIYHFVWIFFLKGQSTYTYALSVYGLASFITIFEIILVSILSLALTKFLTGFNLLAIVEVEKGTSLSYILSKLNPFTFWWLYVIGIGLSEVYSVPKNKSVFTIFALWLIYVIIGRFIPFLSFGV